ncbi:hypothetical protein [Klebsiella pneumoniae]|uniref:hypothetical protein n=1 Tax=Klebsiella pneumoniae TaxID=573 RepID=UPI002D7A0F64|nr:hypothetical protein [Klebsiella pneumoniae]WRP51185.1 hypothetical protein VI614_15875 [Klebsiella pneumoniae]
MTTDITELAQREKFEAWFKSSFHPDKTGPYIKDQLYFAWKAAGAELVQALEKAQAKADVYDMLRDDYGLREKGVGLADFVDWQAKCIAELESRTVTVKLPKPHAHLIWIQAGHAPDDYWDDVAVSHSEKDRCCDGSERYPVYARWEIEEMLAAAGIKVEAD